MGRTTPTQRSLKWARDHEMVAWVVEKWIPIPDHPARGVRKDMFDIIDIVAITELTTIGIQTCSGSTHAGHAKKILEGQYTADWLRAYPARMLELWSWSKRRVPDTPKLTRWVLRREQIRPSRLYLEDREMPVEPFEIVRLTVEDESSAQGNLRLE